jgi:hypothetical protein
MYAVALSVGIVRQFWWQYLGTLRGPLGLLAIPWVVCPLIVLFVAFTIVVIFVVLRSIWLTGSILPTVCLALGIFLAFQVPLPARPDTPEKLHFLKYRADYEETVELARSGKLDIVSGCAVAPTHLKHVSAAGCIRAVNYEDRGLVVFFWPLEGYYHLVAYVEFDNVEYPCGGDPVVEQKIEDHWYVCEYEWN